MNYQQQQAAWRKRRVKALGLIAAGIPRKEIAARLRITRQRLSQIEAEEAERSKVAS